MKARYYVESIFDSGWVRVEVAASCEKAIWWAKKMSLGGESEQSRIRYRGRVIARWKNGKQVTR